MSWAPAEGVAFHASHPLAGRETIALPDLVKERLIAYTRESYPEYHLWLDNLFAGQSRKPVLGEELDSATSLIASVEAGRGVAMVLEGFEGLSGSRLIVRKLEPAPPPLAVCMAWRDGPQAEPIKQFLEAVTTSAH